MSDGPQYNNSEEVVAALEEAVRRGIAISLGYEMRNMLLVLAREVRDMKNRADRSSEE